jgi:hypothetical protein
MSNSLVLELIDSPLYALNDVPRTGTGRLLHSVRVSSQAERTVVLKATQNQFK